MKKRTVILLLCTHGAVAAAGFAAGIYVLPILTAPVAPTSTEVTAVASKAIFSAKFRRDLKDSNAFHWGEGTVYVSPDVISYMGRLAPGPDYKLYLSPEFVETKADFLRLKPGMLRVGDVRTFNNFLVLVPPGVDVAKYTSVIVWCESFSQFITSAKYR